jgi:hypothetical protein
MHLARGVTGSVEAVNNARIKCVRWHEMYRQAQSVAGEVECVKMKGCL